MSIGIRRLMISSFFLSAITRLFRNFFYLLSRVSSFHGYECHRRCYRSTERGTTQTEVAPNRNGDSSSFYHSIHLCSFIFCGWSDSQGHHGIACAHGCSPWHTQWWVVSSEHLCWSYRMTTGYHGWFHYLYLSISTGFIGWKWWWLRQWWCRWGRGCQDASSTWCTYLLSFLMKRGSSFDIRVVIYISGKLA